LEHRSSCQLQIGSQSYEGTLMGAPLISSGELVFTTGMVGYSEAITDPSYFGQILVFTYPLVGNYGIPDHNKWLGNGFESASAQVAGIVLSSDCEQTFHWTSLQRLDSWLKDQNVPGIVGVDTRHLVGRIRNEAPLLGRIQPESVNSHKTLAREFENFDHSRHFFNPSQHEIISAVSTREVQTFSSTLQPAKARIGLIDCGVKWNIPRQLLALGCDITWLPWDADFDKHQVDAWLISNGPGDPTQTADLADRVCALIAKPKPILGICLGHQILSLAAGAKTRKMKFGHRSHNQPVRVLGSQQGFITSQNHGYEVYAIPDDWEVWFENVNDGSCEGIRHKNLPFRSVQFHPEASGGPRDTAWILEEFVEEAMRWAR
jgi:carbamoyl-phosphate synthase small subunit